MQISQDIYVKTEAKLSKQRGINRISKALMFVNLEIMRSGNVAIVMESSAYVASLPRSKIYAEFSGY